MRLYQVYTYDYGNSLNCQHQRAWAADWCAWKLAWKWSERDRKHGTDGWRLMWVKDPWAGYPGWAWGPYSTEAYSYVVPVEVTVP